MNLKKLLPVLLLILLAIAGYAYYQYNKKPTDVKQADAQYTIAANALVQEYDNEEAANAKYLDKIITVSGHVAEVTTDAGSATVILKSDDPMAAVTCSFYDSEVEKVKPLQTGDAVTIKGQCTGKLSDVVLNKCSMVK